MGGTPVRHPALARVHQHRTEGHRRVLVRPGARRRHTLERLGRRRRAVVRGVHGHARLRLLHLRSFPPPMGRKGKADLSPRPDAAGPERRMRRPRTRPQGVQIPVVLGRSGGRLPARGLQRRHLFRARAPHGGDLLRPVQGGPGREHRPGPGNPPAPPGPRRRLSLSPGHSRQPHSVLLAHPAQGMGDEPHRSLRRRRGKPPERARDSLHGKLRRPDLRGAVVHMAGAASPRGHLAAGPERRGRPQPHQALPLGALRPGGLRGLRHRLGHGPGRKPGLRSRSAAALHPGPLRHRQAAGGHRFRLPHPQRSLSQGRVLHAPPGGHHPPVAALGGGLPDVHQQCLLRIGRAHTGVARHRAPPAHLLHRAPAGVGNRGGYGRLCRRLSPPSPEPPSTRPIP